MEILDFIFAKAKLSISMKAIPLRVSTERKIEIKAGRHPLLKASTVVPLDFHIGGATRGVIITGPNTGGKTVALKTIGLLSLMAQCGLHVPAETGCFTMNNYVLCDIGDGQSISENLSTFSSHLINIIQILKVADDQSMVLLEELSGKNCLFVATTHYPEIKEFAKSTPGIINARMAFDRQSLLPLYQLVIGEAGESCALYIAKRLGLPDKMIERASFAAYGEKINITSDVISNEIVYDTQPSKKVIVPEVKKTPRSLRLNIGDSVIVYPQKIIGIVYQMANEKGEVGVQIRDKKLLVNHKRLKLHVPASELYPENYDFSIIFESVENRKKKHAMARKHDPNTVIYSPTDS